MTITTEQLDELEQRARAELSAFVPLRVSAPPDVTLRLVAIARAALAWGEAHDELQGAHYMAVAGGDPRPQRERYGQAIAALQGALRGQP